MKKPQDRIAGGHISVGTTGHRFSGFSILVAMLIFIVGLGILAPPAKSHAQNQALPGAPSLGALVHSMAVIPIAARPSATQDAGQATPPPTSPAAPKPVVLPDGDGKAIATEYCQDCHRLTNLTKAHKDVDDWKDTVHTMMDRGARIPDDKIDLLAQYLAANFGPKDATSGTPTSGTSAATPAPDATHSAPAPAKAVVELPEGEGKAIATENCQTCHKLTNLTKAHKNLDDWKETVQTMIDRGANVPADKVDILVQYLAKNFGPKDAGSPVPATPPSTQPQ